MAGKTPKDQATKETHLYVKFFCTFDQTYVEHHRRKPVPDTAEVDVPLRKLNPEELKFLRKRVHSNWLTHDDDIIVSLELCSLDAGAAWTALRDHLWNVKASDWKSPNPKTRDRYEG